MFAASGKVVAAVSLALMISGASTAGSARASQPEATSGDSLVSLTLSTNVDWDQGEPLVARVTMTETVSMTVPVELSWIAVLPAPKVAGCTFHILSPTTGYCELSLAKPLASYTATFSMPSQPSGGAGQIKAMTLTPDPQTGHQEPAGSDFEEFQLKPLLVEVAHDRLKRRSANTAQPGETVLVVEVGLPVGSIVRFRWSRGSSPDQLFTVATAASYWFVPIPRRTAIGWRDLTMSTVRIPKPTATSLPPAGEAFELPAIVISPVPNFTDSRALLVLPNESKASQFVDR